MKKIKTALTAIVLLFAISAFTMDPGKVSPIVKAAFENDFPNVVKVNWETNGDFYFASFLFNNEKSEAAYNEEGELVATSRNMLTAQVPLNILLAIAREYKGYNVDKTAVEITYQGFLRYYVTVENSTHIYKLKCLSDGELEVDRKTKK